MKIHQWLLVTFTTFLLCFTPLSLIIAQEQLPEIVKRIEPSIVLIQTYDKEGKPLAQGSGFFISKNGDVITSRHVILDAFRAEIKTAQGKVYSITQVVAEDKEGDIIRLSVDIPQKEVKPLSVSSSYPEVGEKIVVVGNPLGLELTVADGIVSAVRDVPSFGKIIQITAPVSPGSSGSPVVNMKGEVIGVATFQLSEGQNLNFAIPGQRIIKLKSGTGKSLTEWQRQASEEWIASAEGLFYMGLVFFFGEEYEKALSYFEKAVLEDLQNADAYLYMGAAYLKLGRYSEAMQAFKQAIRIKPDYAEAHINMGVTYANLGRYTEAIEAYKQAIRIRPDYAEAHCNMGAAYLKLGRYSEAIQAFKQAIRIKPDYAEAHFGMGLVYLLLDDKGSALEQYKILRELNRDLANELFNLIYE